MIRVVVLSLLLAGCAHNVGQPSSASNGATLANAVSHPVQEKKVCRADTDVGSIMSKRICHTASEWAAIDAANSENAQRALDDRQRGAVDRSQ